MSKRKRVSKRDAFKTGYTDPQLVTAAKRNPGGTGLQKSKRGKLKRGEQEPRCFQGGAPGLGKCR